MVEQKSTPNNFWGKKPALLLNPILWNLSFERPVKLPCGLSLFEKCLNGVTLDSWNCQSQNRDHSTQHFFSDTTQDKSFPTHFPCGPIELPHYTVPLCDILMSKRGLAAIFSFSSQHSHFKVNCLYRGNSRISPFNHFLLASFQKVTHLCLREEYLIPNVIATLHTVTLHVFAWKWAGFGPSNTLLLTFSKHLNHIVSRVLVKE